MEQKICTQCKTLFQCGADEATLACWCNELPKIISPQNITDCLCPASLREKINKVQK